MEEFGFMLLSNWWHRIDEVGLGRNALQVLINSWPWGLTPSFHCCRTWLEARWDVLFHWDIFASTVQSQWFRVHTSCSCYNAPCYPYDKWGNATDYHLPYFVGCTCYTCYMSSSHFKISNYAFTIFFRHFTCAEKILHTLLMNVILFATAFQF